MTKILALDFDDTLATQPLTRKILQIQDKIKEDVKIVIVTSRSVFGDICVNGLPYIGPEEYLQKYGIKVDAICTTYDCHIFPQRQVPRRNQQTKA